MRRSCDSHQVQVPSWDGSSSPTTPYPSFVVVISTPANSVADIAWRFARSARCSHQQPRLIHYDGRCEQQPASPNLLVPANQALSSYETNATKSGLLLMPANVRNTIWRLLLSDRSIHITAQASRPGSQRLVVRHKVCLFLDAKEEAQTIKIDSPARTLRPYHKRHQKCGIDFAPNEYGGGAVPNQASQHIFASNKELSVAILQASRQSHDEAALIPFAENTSAFQDDCEIEVFLKQILLYQAQAIRSIVLAPRVYGHVLPMSASKITAKMLLSKLKGL